MRSLIFLISLAALLALPMTGHTMNANSAAKYFDGEYLTASRAIDTGDPAQLAAVTQGLNVDAPGRQHMTLLWYAIQQQNYGAIEVLIRRGSNPDRQEVQGLGTPLYAALMGKDTRVLEAMLDGGLSPDYQDADGTNLLQRATKGQKALDLMRLLLERGANVNLRDNIGGTALDESVDGLKGAIGIYLVEHGASVNLHLTNGSSTAWAVQKTIDRLQPDAMQTPITDISPDKSGKPMKTATTPPSPGSTPEGKELLDRFKELRALMIEKGAKFPPDSPAKIREQMKRK